MIYNSSSILLNYTYKYLAKKCYNYFMRVIVFFNCLYIVLFWVNTRFIKLIEKCSVFFSFLEEIVCNSLILLTHLTELSGESS